MAEARQHSRLSGRAVEPVSGDGRRFNGLNAIRAFAIFWVVAYHGSAISNIAPVSISLPILRQVPPVIDVFFVISGFLIYRPFAMALASGQRVSLGKYVRNRALRVLPLYYTVVLTVFALRYVTPDLSGGRVGLRMLLRSLTFTGLYQHAGTATHVIAVAWTLDDEVLFYMLLPLFFLAVTTILAQARRLRTATIVIIILVVASVVYRVVTYHLWNIVPNADEPNDPLLRNLLAKAAPFGLGMLLANFHAVRPGLALPPRRMAGLLIGGAALLVMAEFSQAYYYPLVELVAGAAYALMVAAIIFAPPASALVGALSWAPLAWAGEFSYGVYLWHGPLGRLLEGLGFLFRSWWLAVPEVYLLTMVLAAVTYFGIERPALRLKKTWARLAPNAAAEVKAVVPDGSSPPAVPERP
jgi:peptidoglycan/LPS O-acetylase OafA/YrhL